MKKVAMISAVVAFLVVMTAFADVGPAEVDINNHVGAPIHVHCDTQNGTVHDIHDQILIDGQNYGWGFTPNQAGITKYHCNFRWGAKARMLLVWIDDHVFVRIPKRPCTHCVWSVTELGFHRSEFGSATAVLAHKWW